MARKFIIDTDPGIDDAMAIITALSMQEFEVLGLVSVAGNVAVEHCTRNALGLVNMMQTDIPVYEGAKDPITYNEILAKGRASDVHGSQGMGDVDLSPGNRTVEVQSGIDFIIDTIGKYPGEIEIIALGPLTNLALAIQKAPDTMKHVKAIWTMGGGYAKGNVTPYAEYNYWADAKAVEIVFDYGVHFPIYMYGLDVTHRSPFHPEDILFVGAEGGPLGKFMLDICLTYIRAYRKFTGKLNFVIHDLLTVVSALQPDVCEYNHCHVSVGMEGEHLGQTICDMEHQSDKPKNVYVACQVDSRRYKNIFIERTFPHLFDQYKELIHNMQS